MYTKQNQLINTTLHCDEYFLLSLPVNALHTELKRKFPVTLSFKVIWNAFLTIYLISSKHCVQKILWNSRFRLEAIYLSNETSTVLGGQVNLYI